MVKRFIPPSTGRGRDKDYSDLLLPLLHLLFIFKVLTLGFGLLDGRKFKQPFSPGQGVVLSIVSAPGLRVV